MKNKNSKIIDEIRKNGVILSGYVRYASHSTCRLSINSRILAAYISSKKDKTKVKTHREGDLFMIYPDEEGNTLRPRVKELVTCISGLKLLKKNEIKFLKSKENKSSFPVKVKISPKMFGLKKYYLYPDQDAAKLAYSLEEKGIEIPERIMTPQAFDYDLEFDFRRNKVVIEITKTKPSEKFGEYRNFRHQPQGARIQAQIFGIYRKCVKSKGTFGMVVVDKNWRNYRHVYELVEECRKINCHLLFVDFDKDWVKKCTNFILENVGNRK